MGGLGGGCYVSGDADTYDAAIATLKRTYDKQPNEIFARHKLSIRKQQNGETLDSFRQALQSLSKDCQFSAVSANEYREEAVRDAFINGLHDSEIRQRLLENRTLDLETAFGQARAMDLARQNSEFYQSISKSTSMHFNAAEINTFAAIVHFQLFCDHLSGAIGFSAIFCRKIARGVSVGLSLKICLQCFLHN